MRSLSSLGTPHLWGGVDTEAYAAAVLATQTANLIAHWRLNETSGTAVVDSSAEGNDGVATGVTWGATGIGDNDTAATFDGINDEIVAYSAGLATDVTGTAGTMLAWVKIGAGGWNDSTNRDIAVFVDDASNYFAFRKTTTGVLRYYYAAGGTAKLVQKASMSATDWICIAITWDAVADEMKAYYNGAQEGATQTSLGVWVGPIVAAEIGNGATLGATNWWEGDLAHVALWTVALSDAEILALASV